MPMHYILIDVDAKVTADGEPEVSSSSEHTQTVGNLSNQTKLPNTLEPFLKLTRCETPKIEVSSSTSSDEVVDVSAESGALDDGCQIVDAPVEFASGCAQKASNSVHADGKVDTNAARGAADTVDKVSGFPTAEVINLSQENVSAVVFVTSWINQWQR